MKMFTILIALIIIPIELFSQNINGKLGVNGLFIIRDTSNTFLSVSQNSGNLSLSRSLILPVTSGSSVGVIYKGSTNFLHSYGSFNIFLGETAGNFTMTGYQNIGIGYQSLLRNTTGYRNTVLGGYTLNNNTTGDNNVGIGYLALSSNSTGSYNTVVGTFALRNNGTGYENTVIGYQSLNVNSTGIINSTLGVNSLYNNTTGGYNTALGHSSLFLNSTGNNNTAVGFNALYYTTGSNNTAVGYGAIVPNSSGDNQVRIGNAFVSYAGVQVAWTITSDRKWKDNITKSNLGLGFISKLNPVSYTRKNDNNKKIEYGFIAQELEKVLKESGVENAGMITIDNNGNYEFRYNDLFAPIVKAIQDLNEENDALKSANEKLTLEMQSLKTMNEKLVKLEKIVNELSELKHAALEVSK